jgi:hypothetical protein
MGDRGKKGEDEVLVAYSHDGEVATITFNRPMKGNSLNTTMGLYVVTKLQEYVIHPSLLSSSSILFFSRTQVDRFSHCF